MTQFNGRTIRSKNTYQKGVITSITNSHIGVSFIKEQQPIYISYQQFLDNILCDEDIRAVIETCNTLHKKS